MPYEEPGLWNDDLPIDEPSLLDDEDDLSTDPRFTSIILLLQVMGNSGSFFNFSEKETGKRYCILFS